MLKCRRHPGSPTRSSACGGPGCGRRAFHGFTLIELLIALAVASVLGMIAIPSFQSQVQRVRRSDAMASLIQIQLAQSRWRSNGTSYGSLTEIGVRNVSGSGHYSLRMSTDSPDSYTVVATALGSQAGDTSCRVLMLQVNGAEITRASGPDSTASNEASVNRRCWGL